MKYVAIKKGQNLLYRELNSESFIDTLKELGRKNWRVEILLAQLNQNKIEFRASLTENYDKFSDFYYSFFQEETTLSRDIFKMLTFDQKMIMFDEFFGACY